MLEFKVEAKPVCVKGSHEKLHHVVELSRAVVTGVVSQIYLQEILEVIARIVQGSFPACPFWWKKKKVLPIDDKIMSFRWLSLETIWCLYFSQKA